MCTARRVGHFWGIFGGFLVGFWWVFGGFLVGFWGIFGGFNLVCADFFGKIVGIPYI